MQNLWDALLAYAMDDAYVATFLVALSPQDLTDGPLSIFQHTVFKKDDVRRLAQTINSALGSDSYGDSELQERLGDVWPKLESRIFPIAASFEQNLAAEENIPSSLGPAIISEVKSETVRLLKDAERILRALVNQPHIPMGALQIRSIIETHHARARVRLRELLSEGYVFVDGSAPDGDTYRITDKGQEYLVQYDLI